MAKKYVDKDGLLYFWQKITSAFVKKDGTKGLSSNDYTTSEKTKLASLKNTTIENVLTSTSTANALSANQGKVLKEMIDEVAADTSSIIDVTTLPTITADNRYSLLRYNNKIYAVGKVLGAAQSLAVGQDVSGAELICNLPDNLWTYAKSYSGLGTDTFVTTTNSGIAGYVGGTNNYVCRIAVGTHGLFDGPTIYSANWNTEVVGTNVTSVFMPDDAGLITAIDNEAVNRFFYLDVLQYIKVRLAEETWICVDNEIAVSAEEPNGNEVLWIENMDVITPQAEKQNIVDIIYPVGSIYMSTNATNPTILFGGIWIAWGSGRVPVGIDTSQTEFNAVNKTGGNKNHTHTLNNAYGDLYIGNTYIYYNRKTITKSVKGIRKEVAGTYGEAASEHTVSDLTLGGTTDSSSNLQPYITCYMWQRTG